MVAHVTAKRLECKEEKKNCRDQDSNLGYYGHNVMS